jgi:hypothetical protein
MVNTLLSEIQNYSNFINYPNYENIVGIINKNISKKIYL